MICDILTKLKSRDPTIKQACLRCDNAGCYHSASTILTIPFISEKSGISIRRLDFSDPQGGKGIATSLTCRAVNISSYAIRPDSLVGPSDRYAAILKWHVRRYLNEKHDVTNAEQFVEACRSHDGVRSVSVVECRLIPNKGKRKFELKNMKQLHNFCYERHGIRVFRAWDIGEGLLIPYGKRSAEVSVWIYPQGYPHINSVAQMSEAALVRDPHLAFACNFVWNFQAVTISSLDTIDLPNLVTFSSSLSNAARSTARVKNDADKSKQRMVVPRLFECSNEGCLRSFLKLETY